MFPTAATLNQHMDVCLSQTSQDLFLPCTDDDVTALDDFLNTACDKHAWNLRPDVVHVVESAKLDYFDPTCTTTVDDCVSETFGQFAYPDHADRSSAAPLVEPPVPLDARLQVPQPQAQPQPACSAHSPPRPHAHAVVHACSPACSATAGAPFAHRELAGVAFDDSFAVGIEVAHAHSGVKKEEEVQVQVEVEVEAQAQACRDVGALGGSVVESSHVTDASAQSRMSGRSERKGYGSKPPTTAKIRLDDLKKVFHLERPKAEKYLNLKRTTFSNLSRHFGISKWPYRTLRDVQKRRQANESLLCKGSISKEKRRKLLQQQCNLSEVVNLIYDDPTESRDSNTLAVLLKMVDSRRNGSKFC